MNNRNIALLLTIGLVILAGCRATEIEMREVRALGSDSETEPKILSSNSVTNPNGDPVGGSTLQRGTNKINLRLGACCLKLQNAYTAWWLIGDVDKSILAVRAHFATGFVADSQEVRLDLELEAGERSFDNPLEGIRLVVLDHGPSTGNPLQLKTPGWGCSSIPCPIVLTTAHPAP